MTGSMLAFDKVFLAASETKALKLTFLLSST